MDVKESASNSANIKRAADGRPLIVLIAILCTSFIAANASTQDRGQNARVSPHMVSISEHLLFDELARTLHVMAIRVHGFSPSWARIWSTECKSHIAILPLSRAIATRRLS